jgi:hypothetical protein
MNDTPGIKLYAVLWLAVGIAGLVATRSGSTASTTRLASWSPTEAASTATSGKALLASGSTAPRRAP